MGVGYLKPNISTIVGKLYAKDDPRRDSGFTIFYMGINIGSFAATLLCGWLGETFGWKYGFRWRPAIPRTHSHGCRRP